MIIDTSALIAILSDEPEGSQLRMQIMASIHCAMSAGSLVELGIVCLNRKNPIPMERFTRLLADARIDIVPVDVRQAEIAWDAYARFGRGRHPAALNFGDCFSYALAIARDEPLLFKGDDFGKTDVRVAA